MNQEKIGKFIAECRKKKKLTQEEFASKINVTNKAVSRWETGRGIPDCSSFNSICNVLDITLEELLSGEKLTSENNDVTINYLAYKEKQRKKNILYITLFSIFILLIMLLSIFFVNNYKNINVYRIYGESENFVYREGFFINSNIKNIFKSGIISSKGKVNMSSISSYTLALSKDNQLYQIYSTSDDLDSFIIEDFGYDEYFYTDEEIDYPTNLYMIISYKIEDIIYREKIELKSEKILTNNKFVYNKIDKISVNNDLKIIDFLEKEDLSDFKKVLKDDGFIDGSYVINSEKDKYVQKKIGDNEYIVVDYVSKHFHYFYNFENRSSEDASIRASFLLDSKYATDILFNVKSNGKSGAIFYDVIQDKIDYNDFPELTDKAMDFISYIKKYNN